ncbi:thioredoxin domain-containing protein [Sphingomonas nostoxanthinifaciens]|uniref:thioredoxin domain-containing protein n=1 Tax=Sphingomonas nostoxanthinifaciens TaxID=2872652 RepID=UPI001CC1DC30|nr:thioredoxin domain-containing protein [Sphingomonas nostoxanthinifaciens]UAK26170.1 DsbA family protein [Sphingomonas nostoxanthinifaciens]
MRRLALALLLLAVPSAIAAPAHVATRDWSKVASRTPNGSFVEGNPDAKVKLVEYLSLTCPHCAKFEGEAIAPLTAKYVRTGLVSYEVRHALRDPFDFAASLLARCNGPEQFFVVMPIVYAQQPQWAERASQWSTTSAPKDEMAPEKLLPLAASGAGLDALFAAHGVAPAKAQACLTDPHERDTLSAMANEAWHRPNFPGTPAFLINGVAADGVATWPDLDKRLAAALRK